ncbi:hypothetical protein HYH03_015636 [Edaphochlamys debaryana]|uniref:Uncharacterized protein n=1 Tax=Edaphochlamys debaryana TaxID=47281 RepID=A0A836BSB9_9CHLO|nr:hypothetical protein HYH03_015636 [Edaphochlamys debaryana]|eukprot:KAG2485664.1 hypothetical protein HYH03_015636 [Edaphochlamys debaryana]
MLGFEAWLRSGRHMRPSSSQPAVCAIRRGGCAARDLPRRSPRHVATTASYGPQPSGDLAGAGRKRKPEWVKILEEDADNDPEVARLLEGTDGDPDLIREKMQFKLREQDLSMEGRGSAAPPRVSFRAISPLGLWVWMEFAQEPVAGEKEMLEGVLKSWFAVGKLGGYNSQNLQVYQNADDDQSYFDYDNDDMGAGEQRMASYIHDIGEVEFNESWARVWIDMGTADELALDVLINTLVGYSANMAALKSVTLGGSNEDWPVPEEYGQDSDYMKVGINPMRLPTGLDEEFQFMDEEGMFEGGKGKGRDSNRMLEAAADDNSGIFDVGDGGTAYGSGRTGYGIDAGPMGSTAEERELQEIAARLKRRPTAGGKGGGKKGPGGYYGGGYGGLDNVGDVNPDELEFIDEDEDLLRAAGGEGAGAGAQEQKKPWGASFVRRKAPGSGSGSGGQR